MSGRISGCCHNVTAHMLLVACTAQAPTLHCAGTLVHHSYGHWIVTSGTVVGAGALNGCKTVQISEPLIRHCPVCHCAGITRLNSANALG